MTLSSKDRLDAMQRALIAMLHELGDQMFIGVRLEIQSSPFVGLPQTTWLELESEGYVQPAHAFGSPAFKFTGKGWIAALRAAKAFDTQGQRERAVKLKSALKDAVKGRPLQGALTDLWSLQGHTGLPLNWIGNAIDSRLLQHLWPEEHLDLDLEKGLRAIRVPARFGSERLSGLTAGPFADP